jgi:hypothetical protein
MPRQPTLADAFAFEDSQLAAWGGEELLRCELLMDYSQAMLAESTDVEAVAAVRWTVLSDKFQNETSVNEFKIILAASLYAKILTLDQSRKELFRRLGDALRKVIASKDLSSMRFDPWVLQGRTVAGSFQNLVWPWQIAEWDEVEARRPSAFVEMDGVRKNLLKEHVATLLKGSAMGLIRFRGHFPKGGYDVQNGIKQSRKTGAATVHGGIQDRSGSTGVRREQDGRGGGPRAGSDAVLVVEVGESGARGSQPWEDGADDGGA